MTYHFTRAHDGRYDVYHGEGCYDGRFTRHQLGNFIVQLSREGNTVVDDDNHCVAETPADIID
jgi:hypothetical protein